MLDHTKNILIGLFVVTALMIITYMILFLHPSVGNEGQTLHVRFSNIDKVGVGTRVLFAGHPVGEVVSIREVEDARLDGQIHHGEIYIYELTLKIDTGIDVYTSDEIAAKTSGLLGERSVSINPRPPKRGESLVKVTDQILYAVTPQNVDDAIREFNALAKKGQKTLNKLNEQLDVIQEEEFWENLGDTAKNLNEITSSLNRPEDISKMMTNIRDFSDHLKETGPKLERMLDNLMVVTDHARKGEGTLGKLMMTDDFYLRVTSTMNKAETLMDDINHFGLLFQHDKTWQRLRARRANLMAKLSEPQEFKNFFNDEVNQISTSLSRLSMVLKDSTQCEYLPILLSSDFTKAFADFLRRVEGLESHLKMFDQQLIEKAEKTSWDCGEVCPPLLGQSVP